MGHIFTILLICALTGSLEIVGATITWPRTTKTVSVPENVTSSDILATAIATSSTGATNISYSVVKQTVPGTFVIETDSGVVGLAGGNHLDYETVTQHLLTLSAKANGATAETGTTTLTVNVTDVNDNAPAFAKLDYSATVSSTAPTNTLILTVNAIDNDGTSPNNEIGYTVARNDSHFRMVPSTGEMRTTGVPFNIAKETMFALTVLAVDKGLPHQVGISHVRICLDKACPPITTTGAATTPFLGSSAKSGSTSISQCPCHCSGASYLSESLAFLTTAFALFLSSIITK